MRYISTVWKFRKLIHIILVLGVWDKFLPFHFNVDETLFGLFLDTIGEIRCRMLAHLLPSFVCIFVRDRARAVVRFQFLERRLNRLVAVQIRDRRTRNKTWCLLIRPVSIAGRTLGREEFTLSGTIASLLFLSIYSRDSIRSRVIIITRPFHLFLTLLDYINHTLLLVFAPWRLAVSSSLWVVKCLTWIVVCACWALILRSFGIINDLRDVCRLFLFVETLIDLPMDTVYVLSLVRYLVCCAFAFKLDFSRCLYHALNWDVGIGILFLLWCFCFYIIIDKIGSLIAVNDYIWSNLH